MTRNQANNSNRKSAPRVNSIPLGMLDPFEGGDWIDEDNVAEGEGLRLVDLMGFARDAQATATPSTSETSDAVLCADATATHHPALDGFYAKFVRPLANLAVTLCVLPVLFALAVPIALVNLLVFRDLRLVFYSQKRVGQYGRIFRIYKFRTMAPISGCNFAAWSDGDQNRVTNIGKILRSTHLDEIPQIFNILLGDMDLIGPRPEMVQIHNWATEHVDGFARRLTLRPGITGLAQITQGYTGQCPEAYAEKLAADESYLSNLSATQDLIILFRTVLWMARGKGWKWQAK
jgi:lipopolysaccharide/colanic/teichoic acid biosynthesis glycosyltransferase